MSQQIVRKWKRGEKAFIAYRYSPEEATVVEVEVKSTTDRRGYTGVLVPSLFGDETFGCQVGDHQIFPSREAAESRPKDESYEDDR